MSGTTNLIGKIPQKDIPEFFWGFMKGINKISGKTSGFVDMGLLVRQAAGEYLKHLLEKESKATGSVSCTGYQATDEDLPESL